MHDARWKSHLSLQTVESPVARPFAASSLVFVISMNPGSLGSPSEVSVATKLIKL